MNWISVKEAAALLGYNADYFRRTFCEPAAPLLPIRQRRGPKGRILTRRLDTDMVF